MAISGSDLITRLQNMVKIEQHRRQRAFASNFGNAVRARMEELGRGELAGEAFDEIRKWKRDENLLRQDVANVGEKARRNMPHAIPEEVLRILYQEYVDLFERLQSELNSLRSKTTHVSAVFRPFRQKYFDEWADAVVDFRKSQLMDRAEELRARQITDHISFQIWADDLYSLFRDSAVFNPTEMTLKPSSGSATERDRIALPMGMIRSGSERIYGQQWRLWIRENLEEIAEYIESTSEDSRARVTAIVNSISASRDQRPTNKPKVEMLSEGTHEPEPKRIELEVALQSDPTLSAKQLWETKELALEGLGDFLETLQDAWSAEDEPVRCTIKFGNSIVPFRPLTLQKASSFLADFLIKRK